MSPAFISFLLDLFLLRAYVSQNAASETRFEGEVGKSEVISVEYGRGGSRGTRRRSLPPPRYVDLYQENAPGAGSPRRRGRGSLAQRRKNRNKVKTPRSSFVEDVEIRLPG